MHLTNRGKFAVKNTLHLLKGAIMLNDMADSSTKSPDYVDKIRMIAAELSTLADEIQGGASPLEKEDIRSDNEYLIASDPESERTVQYDDMRLAVLARSIHKLRSRRMHWFHKSLFSEPVWDMLLEAFFLTVVGKPIMTKSLMHGSGVAPTTALRWIDVLVENNIVEREKNKWDPRVTNIHMTKKGYLSMRECLSEWMQSSKENPTLLSLMHRRG